MSRNSQKSYSEHFLQSEALGLLWDESFREQTLTPLGNKDSCPRIYTCQGRKKLPMSAKQIFQTRFFPFTRNVIKMMGMLLNPVSLFLHSISQKAMFQKSAASNAVTLYYVTSGGHVLMTTCAVTQKDHILKLFVESLQLKCFSN